ncbi:keywimysin-related RiPP [Streptomyces cellostaticus]|nr:keywimysin-related RiPP [Streptomyces cellostaticus]
MKKAYEAPTLVRLGTFRKVTGLLARHGNDRVIFSKN